MYLESGNLQKRWPFQCYGAGSEVARLRGSEAGTPKSDVDCHLPKQPRPSPTLKSAQNSPESFSLQLRFGPEAEPEKNDNYDDYSVSAPKTKTSRGRAGRRAGRRAVSPAGHLWAEDIDSKSV